VRKRADEEGSREICKADFWIEHTLLEVSRGCWIVRASTTNAKRKYFFFFVHHSIALLNWLVRKHLHTRNLDLILSSSLYLYSHICARILAAFSKVMRTVVLIELMRISLNERENLSRLLEVPNFNKYSKKCY